MAHCVASLGGGTTPGRGPGGSTGDSTGVSTVRSKSSTSTLGGTSVGTVRSTRGSPSGGSALRKTPAFEDVWLGYAIAAFLPRDASRRLTLVAVDPTFVFDDSRFSMHNLTTLVHWKHGKGYAKTFFARMRAAHAFAEAHSCLRSSYSEANAPVLICSHRHPSAAWAMYYPTWTRGSSQITSLGPQPSCEACAAEAYPWVFCEIVPLRADFASRCPGYRRHGFGSTSGLWRQWVGEKETLGAAPLTTRTCAAMDRDEGRPLADITV